MKRKGVNQKEITVRCRSIHALHPLSGFINGFQFSGYSFGTVYHFGFYMILFNKKKFVPGKIFQFLKFVFALKTLPFPLNPSKSSL